MSNGQDKLELQLSFGPRALTIMAASLGSVFLVWLVEQGEEVLQLLRQSAQG